MDERLKEIEEALSKATPGPWKLGPGCIYTNYTGTVKPVCITPNDDYNAHLIANAPEWLRYTLNEIKRLQDALTVAGKRIDFYQD